MKYFGCDPDTKWGSRQQDWNYADWKEKTRLALRFILTCIVKYIAIWPYTLISWLFPDDIDTTIGLVAVCISISLTLAWLTFIIGKSIFPTF